MLFLFRLLLRLAVYCSGCYFGSLAVRKLPYIEYSSFCNCFFLSLWNESAPCSIFDLTSALCSFNKITRSVPHRVYLTQYTILIGFSLLPNVALISFSQSRLEFKCRPEILVNSIRFLLYHDVVTWIQRHLVVSETLLVVVTSTDKVMNLWWWNFAPRINRLLSIYRPHSHYIYDVISWCVQVRVVEFCT
jgi:hypothetical protein